MNRRQKLSYMALGAVIMAVGIGLGAVFSPPLVAQRNVVGGAIGVFDEIRCGKLITVDETGNEYVTIGRGIIIENPLNKAEIALYTPSIDDPRVDDIDIAVWVKDRNGKDALQVVSRVDGNFLEINNRIGERRVMLGSGLDISGFIAIYDATNKIKWFAP